MRSPHFALIILAVGIVLSFQNCARTGFSSRAMTLDLPMNHPSILSPGDSVVVMAKSRAALADRRYIESAMSEAFLSSASTQNEKDFLNAVFMQEFNVEQHLLGRGCDPMEHGDSSVCNNILNNAQISMAATTSSGREAIRVQVCRRVIANDTMFQRILAKVANTDITPNAQSMDAIVRLFYPNLDQEVVNETVKNLAELDLAMAQGNEHINDRWKILLLTVCESSGWEAL